MVKNTLTESEARRFRLQMNLPGIGREGQEKLKNTRIGIVGAGGTGATVLQYLASVGIGHFTIIDNGIVDELAIQRQTLYGATDLGKLKTITSRQRLQILFPLTEFQIINLELTRNNCFHILSPFDVIIDASNNTQTNYIINDTCIELNKSWVYSAVNGPSVLLSVFNYNQGPSLRCYPAEPEYSTDQAISLAYALAGIFTSIETLKLITNQENILNGKILQLNCFDYAYTILPILRNEINFKKNGS